MIFTQLGERPTAPKDIVPFRFRQVGGEVLLTNDWGDWVFVTKDELARMAKGELVAGSPLHARLASKNFIRSTLDESAIAERMRYRKRFLDYGPNLHIDVCLLPREPR
jgi:uncharacterized protein